MPATVPDAENAVEAEAIAVAARVEMNVEIFIASNFKFVCGKVINDSLFYANLCKPHLSLFAE